MWEQNEQESFSRRTSYGSFSLRLPEVAGNPGGLNRSGFEQVHWGQLRLNLVKTPFCERGRLIVAMPRSVPSEAKDGALLQCSRECYDKLGYTSAQVTHRLEIETDHIRASS